MNQQQLRQVYQMVDNIPFSRGKKNISRDFSDGVMMAQLVHYYRPKIVQLHSYSGTSSVTKKMSNWETLNNKVLKKLGIGLNKKQMQDIVNCVPMAVQSYLYSVLKKFQSPGEQVNVRNQIKKVQPISPNKPKNMNNFGMNNSQNHNQQMGTAAGNSVMTFQDKQRDKDKQSKASFNKNLTLGKQTDQVFELIQQIEQAYEKLLKLQQISKLKDECIKNLEKKVQKMIFS